MAVFLSYRKKCLILHYNTFFLFDDFLSPRFLPVYKSNIYRILVKTGKILPEATEDRNKNETRREEITILETQTRLVVMNAIYSLK